MKPTEIPEANETSLVTRTKRLRKSVVGRIGSMTESGKATIARRRDDRHRDELLRELGELHVTAAAAGADSPDKALADRLIAEIVSLDGEEDDDEKR